MKKQLAILLTGLLALSLCACKTAEPEVPPADETPAVQETVQPTPEPTPEPVVSVASAREPQISHIIMMEGMEEEITSTLQIGDGYSFYLPDGDWVVSGPNCWEGRYNEDVKCWVDAFENRTAQDVEEELTLMNNVEVAPGLWMYDDTESGFRTYVHIFANDSRAVTFTYSYFYNSEMVEGWGTRLPNIADTFMLEP